LIVFYFSVQCTLCKYYYLGNYYEIELIEECWKSFREMGSAGEGSGKEALKQSESAVSKVRSRFK
jgi:hypothetical protein